MADLSATYLPNIFQSKKKCLHLRKQNIISTVETENPFYSFDPDHAAVWQIVEKTESYAIFLDTIKQLKQLFDSGANDATLSEWGARWRYQKRYVETLRYAVWSIYDIFRTIPCYSNRLRQAETYFYQGKLAEMDAALDSDQAREEVRAIREDHSPDDKNWRNKAYILMRAWSYELIIKALYRDTLLENDDRQAEICALFEKAHDISGNVHTLYELAYSLRSSEDSESVFKMLDDATELADELEEEYCLTYRAKCPWVKGIISEKNKDSTAAARYFGQSVEIYRRLCEKNPAEYGLRLTDLLTIAGEANLKINNFTSALALFDEAANIRRQQVLFDDHDSALTLAETIDRQALTHNRLGDEEESLALYEESLQIKNHNAHNAIDPYTFLESKSLTLHAIASTFLAREAYEKALPFAREEVQILRQLLHLDIRLNMVEALDAGDNLVKIYDQLERHEDALREQETHSQIFRWIAERCPDEEDIQDAWGNSLFHLSTLYIQQSMPNKFLNTMKEALKIYRRLLVAHPESEEYKLRVSFLLGNIALCYERFAYDRKKMRIAALEAHQLLSSIPRDAGAEKIYKEVKRMISLR
jgi:tetratricopeptide (TPR) repeat protein